LSSLLGLACIPILVVSDLLLYFGLYVNRFIKFNERSVVTDTQQDCHVKIHIHCILHSEVLLMYCQTTPAIKSYQQDG